MFIRHTDGSIMTALLLAVVVLCWGGCARGYRYQQSLDGEWRLDNEGRGLHLPAVVPGGVYSDLERNGVINDTLYRFNDEVYRWVARENWTYTRTFNVSEEMLRKRRAVVVFHGLDTVADVHLNGRLLGSTDNMFVRYQFDVKDVLRTVGNELQVVLYSPTTSATSRYSEQAKRYVVPPPCVDEAYHGECHANFLRKMQASFAWDWGPAFPSVGVWKSAELVAYDSAYLRDVTLRYTQDNKNVSMYFDYLLETGTGENEIEGTLVASLVYDESTVFTSEKKQIIKLSGSDEDQHFSHQLSFDRDVELWYPNGLGKQKLYKMSFQFVSSDGAETSRVNISYGFVNHKLVEDRIDENDESKGTTFNIRTNGVDYFHKGVNWIPSNILQERASNETTIRRLLKAVRDGNMNIIRVWGGGLYESDLFYEIADEYGIMVWQDFMFACSMYPTGEEFLASVRTEVTQQVRRLQRHPSIALWSGNNENEGALRDNWYGTGGDFDLYKQDYIKLYVDTVMRSVQAADDTKDFVVSSPSNGKKTVEEGYVAENPSDVLYGDIHFYDYDINGWDSTKYRIPRFSSEYGFQSYPSLSSLKEVAEPSDLVYSSQFVSHRQHHPSGNLQIELQIQKNIPFTVNSSSVESFGTLIYLSQINQAMSTKTETEHYRRCQSVLTSEGQGYTMGAMYWQLNDVWQAPSWSSIEFNGRWKMLQYYAKNFFSPVLLSPYITASGNFEVAAISDLHYENTTLLNYDIIVMKYDSLTPLFTEHASTNLMLNRPVVTKSVNLNTYLSSAGCGSDSPTEKCFVYIRPLTSSGIQQAVPDNFLFPGSLGALRRVPVTVTVTRVTGPTRTAEGEDQFEVEVSSAGGGGVALFVWLEAGPQLPADGVFSDNGFHMVQPTRRLAYTTAAGSARADTLRDGISVTTLNDKLAS